MCEREKKKRLFIAMMAQRTHDYKGTAIDGRIQREKRRGKKKKRVSLFSFLLPFVYYYCYKNSRPVCLSFI